MRTSLAPLLLGYEAQHLAELLHLLLKPQVGDHLDVFILVALLLSLFGDVEQALVVW